jgi:glycerol-3-phosphate dehydrogenase (NAD(P)+)
MPSSPTPGWSCTPCPRRSSGRGRALGSGPRRSAGGRQLSLAKGYELGTLKRPTEIIGEETEAGAAALSGPNHAEEVSRDMPSATVIASEDDDVAATLQEIVTSDTFRVYTNDDVIGVEFCGASKNPIAVAVGMSDGLGFGDNSRASLITRSVVEMTRLGIVQGAQMSTFTGLAGIGDLIATCTSRHSRNRLAGELLAKGASPGEVELKVGQVVEGIPTAYALHDLATRLGIDMPVTENVYRVLEGRRTPQECVADLMGRSPKRERHERLRASRCRSSQTSGRLAGRAPRAICACPSRGAAQHASIPRPRRALGRVPC